MSTVTSASATVVKAVFNGLASQGAIPLVGLNPGDVLIRCLPDGFQQGFEPIVSASGQLAQIANLDWSAVSFTCYFLRGA